MSQPHRAARLEGRVHAVIERTLQTRGWTPRVVPYVGYGAAGWVRVLARVLLTPPGTPRSARENGRGWRRFVSTSAAGVPVTIRIGSQTHEVITDRDGYLDLRLAGDLEPGWASATCTVGDAEPVAAPLRIVGPDTRLGLVSDIDDTVIITMLPRPLLAFRNAFLVRETDRRPVPGMAGLYAEIVKAHPDVFVVYLSTGAWNAAVALTGFLERHGYPRGPLLMTDWGPTTEGWFRSGQAHKRTQLTRLVEELPHLRWLLVGDDGQHDPSLYAEAARTHPEQVLGIAIRQLSLTEQLAHGNAIATDTTASVRHPPVLGPDGFVLSRALRARGIVLGGPDSG